MVLGWIDLSDKSVWRQKLNDTLRFCVHVDFIPTPPPSSFILFSSWTLISYMWELLILMWWSSSYIFLWLPVGVTTNPQPGPWSLGLTSARAYASATDKSLITIYQPQLQLLILLILFLHSCIRKKLQS